ncbi:hydroxyethylthiazole kinase [Kineosporia sp. J2-2]|uniref:Hydroxyethylthiazole kinase n=1 Tax=Kineosporia corallincola TaxID=2835133 RepID=A0ABS5TSK0_9ACTN|nr:hydroxyethylthiazole kinase [Kineosporia corallincola]MBT0773775.1 hydroxyethylthiazole kinase [Kineosporia corallincola]
MEEISWQDEDVRKGFAAIAQASPFVYGLTNYIAANLSANVLLAVGAGPAIGAASDWTRTFPAGAGGVWINTAGLMSSIEETFTEVARTARAAGTPWVLDPVAVGAGAAEYDAFVKSLLEFRPAIIRGNASELIALGGGAALGKGVETTASSAEAVDAIAAIARATGAVVAVSGPVDYITDGTTTVAVPGGDARLTQVTGAGCSLGALCAAAAAAGNDPFSAARIAHAAYAAAAERAGARTTGTGSFAVALVDELSLLTA